MSRALARIKHDEVVRLVKAVRACGLDVSRVSFDGAKVDVIIGHSGEQAPTPVDEPVNAERSSRSSDIWEPRHPGIHSAI